MRSEIDLAITAIDAIAAPCGPTDGIGRPSSGTAVDEATLRPIAERLHRAIRQTVDADRANVLTLQSMLQTIARLRNSLEAVQVESRIDPLTSLATREQFDPALVEAIAAAQANRRSLSLMMCDIDHFERFTDEFGHAIGDDVLRLVGVEIDRATRRGDVAVRYGGAEFAIICTNTPLRVAIDVAERLRWAVSGRTFVECTCSGALGRVTMSIGLAELRSDDTARSLVGRAVRCLYAAKRRGRDRVVAEVQSGDRAEDPS